MTDPRFERNYEEDGRRRRDFEPRRWHESESRQGPRGFERFEDWEQPRDYEGDGRRDWEGRRDFRGRWDFAGGRDFGGRRDFEFRRFEDERSRPRESFYGRGPKGWQRSDDRLREEICERLTADPHVDASEITVNVREGEVTLEGSVENRGMKRAAEDAADGVLGLRQVHNRLRIEPSRRTDGSRRGEEGTGATSRSQDVSSFSPETQRSGGSRTPGKSSS
jgi:hypothetical protein